MRFSDIVTVHGHQAIAGRKKLLLSIIRLRIYWRGTHLSMEKTPDEVTSTTRVKLRRVLLHALSIGG
jgi:hypothetical protein